MSRNMISHFDALDIINGSVISLKPKVKSILECLGLVLAEDIFSPMDIPGFNQSAMDGYAIKLGNEPPKSCYSICGEVAAGERPTLGINSDDAVRIFTGAALPEGFDTVVMQEKTKLHDKKLFITDENLHQGQNIRLQGAEIKSGACAIQKGALISPATIGYLAGMGITHASVYPKPKVTLIITGNEIRPPGTLLDYGQIYDSNSFTLVAALRQMEIHDVSVIWAKDNLHSLTTSLKSAIHESDLILLTGGISVGKYDFVLEATQLNNIEQQFYKVKQKPGKPIYFGTKKEKLVFGLPGNPASVLTCFYLYVSKALDLQYKCKKQSWTKAMVSFNYEKNKGITHFLKGEYSNGIVKLLGAQESFRLSSFALANCLIRIDETITDVVVGSEVDILLLPA